MHIGNRISYLRKKKAISQGELSKGIISSTHLSNIEQGRYTPSVDILLPLENKMNLIKGYLVDYNLPNKELTEFLHVVKQRVINQCDHQLLEELQNVDITSIINLQQEVLFSMLYCSCLYKNNLKNEAELHVKEHLSNFICPGSLSEIPLIIRETYLYMLGIRSYYHNMYGESLLYFEHLLEIETDEKIKASIFYNLALLSKKLDKHHDAVYFANQAVKSHLDNHNWDKVAEVRNFIGVLHLEHNELEKAAYEFQKVLDLLSIINQKELVLARVLHNQGLICKSKGEFVNALDKFNESITLKLQLKKNTTITDIEVISCYILMKDSKLAKQHVEKSYTRTSIEADLLLLDYQAIKIEELIEKETIDMRIDLIKKTENAGYIELLIGQYESLAELLLKKKKYKQAAECFQKELWLKRR